MGTLHSLPEVFARGVFALRHKWNPIARLRTAYYRSIGMRVGRGTSLVRVAVTWPHQVCIGERCRVEHDVYFHYDGVYRDGPRIVLGDDVFVGAGTEFNIAEGITVGSDALIAAGCRFVDHNHGTARGEPMRRQPGPPARPIAVGRDAWIGANAVVLKGVTVGDGAVVAAGAVVTRSVPAGEIWGGVPARPIGRRTVAGAETGSDGEGGCGAD